MKKMLDISKWQGSFNPGTAKAQGVSTVLCRCAYDTSKDVRWDVFAPAVKANGMNYGAYGFLTAHYASVSGNFAQALVNVQRQVGLWIAFCREQGYTVLAVDQELEKDQRMVLGKADNTKLLQEAVALIRAAGMTPLVYTGADWTLRYVDWQAIDADFWIAYYPSSTAASDFAVHTDGSFPAGQYGDLLRAVKAAGKLFAWQYGSIGGLGRKYGASSDNIDRNWQYKEIGSEKGESDGMMNFYEVFGQKNCQCFTAPDVNAVDTSYNGGTLKSGSFYPVMADAGTGADGYHWYKVYAGGATRYAVLLDDRSRITALSAGDAVKAMEAQVVCADGGTAALEQKIEQLTARAATAEAKAEQAQGIADGYLARIKAAQAALEG